MRGKQWNCLTLQVLVNNHRVLWNFGNCTDQCRNWNIVILLNFKQKWFKALFLDNPPTDESFQTVWVLHLLLILINLFSLPSDSFFDAVWTWTMKQKIFPFKLRTLLVNDPLFVYFNVCFMAFVVLNAHWLNLLLSTWWKHYLIKNI